MTWADYSRHKRKAKLHFGFDLNGAIPRKIFLSDGKAAERPFVSLLLEKGQTGVMDRGYQEHARFDAWINDEKHFVVRVKKNIQYHILERLAFQPRAYQPRGEATISFFAKVLLGDENHQMTHPVFLVGFSACGKAYWVVTICRGNCFHLFFEVENRNLLCMVEKIQGLSSHLISSRVVHILILYLLLVIYFHQRYDDKPCVTYRQLKYAPISTFTSYGAS